jgi:tetratricopeptide (TPR) repeat protein
MNDLNEALQWLNMFDKSHLRDTTRARLDDLKSEMRSSQEIADEIGKLVADSRQNEDALEYPEVLVHGGFIEYINRHLMAAHGFLRDALRIYEGHHHRQAVIQWMLGWIEWELLEIDSATQRWMSVHDTFSVMGEWYLGQAQKINYGMRVTRAALFEEAFGWLNIFEPSHLIGPARELQTIMDQKLVEMDFSKEAENATWVIYQLMDKLLDETHRSTDIMETAEAYIECGLAAYHMGHMSEAVRYLEMAIHRYQPDTHQQAVAKWLVGIIQWDLDGHEDLARRNWHEAIKTFEQNGLNALHRNLSSQASWYTDILHVMNDALTAKIRVVYQ